MSRLFSPLTIKSVTLKNRLVVSPMCQYSAEDGFANDWHLVHLGSRAVCGAALVIQEATAVSPEGRISYGDLGIWKDEHIEKLKQITTFIHQNGSVAGIQLAHAGRKASHEIPWKGGVQIIEGPKSWPTVSASPVVFTDGEMVPHELGKEEIKRVISDFKSAASRALAAGYRVVEIHAAHGYLVHQFLSPFSNQRTDEYGVSFENRIRFLLEIIGATKEVWPEDLPLFVRISATDWKEGGWSIEESIKLSAILKENGVDLIDTSTGGNITGVKIPLTPGYQVPFAARIKQEAGIMTGAVGLINTAQQAEDILSNGEADLILMARQMLRDPYFPVHAAHELGEDIQWPSQYERAKPK
jgi:2,4-dienoyl-CoA reductase-like NADH-dependent reductase (Old Yellow Enzyme family)